MPISTFSIPVTESTELRLRQIEDAPAFFDLVVENKEYLRQWLSWVDHYQVPEDATNYLRKNLEGFEAGTFPDLGIWHDGAWIGSIGFHDLDANNRSASIGYWLSAAHQGKGIMSQCVAALITHGFDHLNLNRIQILCATGNAKSRAIPERLGLTHEGTLRQNTWIYDHFIDSDVYSVLREEWEPAATNGAC